MRTTVPYCVLVAFAFIVSSVAMPAESENGGSEDYSLSVNESDTVVSFISGNFSVAITSDWPRMIFRHEEDPFSPTFEVSCPRLYAHNDSDGDGMFDPSEAVLTIFLDSNHIEWNRTPLSQGYSDELGEYAYFGMRAELNAYIVGENETLARSKWANMSFWFSISEKSVEYENARGIYVVEGATQLRMNYSLDVRDWIDQNAIVLEQFLQGGGSTNMFHLVEEEDGVTFVTEIPGTVDERESGEDYNHKLEEISGPMREILFAKEDGTVQAFYSWCSEVAALIAGNRSSMGMNSTYFTTGTGMMLHSQIMMDNRTSQIGHESCIGIYESGFVGSMSDWLREYSWPLLAVCCVVAALASFPLLRWRKRRRMRGDGSDGVGE